MSETTPRHACRVCVTGRYIDAERRREHESFCGIVFQSEMVIRVAQGDGIAGMEGVDCEACLVAFDAWAQTQEPSEVDWSLMTATS